MSTVRGEKLLPPGPKSLRGEMGFAGLGESRVGVVKTQVQTRSGKGGVVLTYKYIYIKVQISSINIAHAGALPGSSGTGRLTCTQGHLGRRVL